MDSLSQHKATFQLLSLYNFLWSISALDSDFDRFIHVIIPSTMARALACQTIASSRQPTSTSSSSSQQSQPLHIPRHHQLCYDIHVPRVRTKSRFKAHNLSCSLPHTRAYNWEIGEMGVIEPQGHWCFGRSWPMG